MASPHAGPPAAAASTWEVAMDHGRAALCRDLAAAYRHFGRAHGLGHNDLARHLTAHACLVAVARGERRPTAVGPPARTPAPRESPGLGRRLGRKPGITRSKKWRTPPKLAMVP